MTESLKGSYREFYEQDGRRRLRATQRRMEEYRFRWIIRELSRGLASAPSDGGPVLDAGAGWGQLSVQIAHAGYEVIPVDLARTRLERLRCSNSERPSTHPTRLHPVQATLDSLPLATDWCDAAICSEILEHLPEPAPVLREIRRVLRPGAPLIVTVPFDEVLREVVCPNCLESFVPHGHVHSFDRPALARLLTTAGFQVNSARVIKNWLVAALLRREYIGYGLASLLDRLHPPLSNHGWLLATATPRSKSSQGAKSSEES